MKHSTCFNVLLSINPCYIISTGKQSGGIGLLYHAAVYISINKLDFS